MKILVLTDLFPTPTNPEHGIFIYHWASHLAKYCDLTVYQVIFEATKPSTDQKFFGHYPERFLGSDTFTWIKRSQKIGHFDRIWRRSFQFYRYVMEELGEDIRQYDLIIGQMGCPGGYAAVKIASRFSKKALVGVRGSDVNFYLRRPILKNCMHYTLRHADHVVTVSQALKTHLTDAGYPDHRISVIYNGVNQDYFRPIDPLAARRRLNLPLTEKILLFIGSLCLEKGIDLLLQAFRAIERHDVKLFFIGTGGGRRLITKFIDENDLRNRINLVGTIPQSELADWYAAADLLVLPSRSEGVPNVILEALAVGTPVVASEVGGIPEILEPGLNGLLHQSNSLKDLTEKIQLALEFSWERTKIYQSAGRFSWDRNAAEYYQIINKILTSS